MLSNETKKETADILRFLYPNRRSDHVTQLVYATRDKKALLWLPGKKNAAASLGLIKEADILGLTGRTYPNTVYTMTADIEDKVEWHWLGIDVDDCEDVDRAGELIAAALPWASIRVSTGGHGLHILTRIVPKCFDKSAIPDIQAGWVKRIEAIQENVGKVCKFDGRTFYFVGGKNRWIKQTNTIVDISSLVSGIAGTGHVSSSRTKLNPAGETVPFDSLGNGVQKVLEELEQADVAGVWSGRVPVIQGVYIKEVYNALKDKYSFKTKSPMSSNDWHVNGWAKITLEGIKIRGFADEWNCLDIFDDSL